MTERATSGRSTFAVEAKRAAINTTPLDNAHSVMMRE